MCWAATWNETDRALASLCCAGHEGNALATRKKFAQWLTTHPADRASGGPWHAPILPAC